MYLPAKFIPYSIKVVFLFLLLTTSYLLLVTPAYAQSRQDESNLNHDVPLNDHTRSQSVLIESMSAIICQLAGVDVIDPEKGCLGIDPTTKKIGYVQNPEGQPGGLLGTGTVFLGYLYVPPASGVSYMANSVKDFGIVKNAYAQESGIDQLRPIESLWLAARNMTYIFFVIIFILIGVGIMLRFKIDPRTVMSIQNQLPKIIIGILMITFSFAIVGFLIDVMWLGTYVGINMLAPASNQHACHSYTVQEAAYSNLLDHPLSFANNVMNKDGVLGDCMGLASLAGSVGDAIGSIISEIVEGVIIGAPGDCSITSFDLKVCVYSAVGNAIGFIAGIASKLIAIIALLIILFRLWFTLLKNYAYVIVYTVLAPFWILLGMIPGSSFGFGPWFRTMAAKLTAFPVAAFFIVIARVILDVYDQAPVDARGFVPPLIGNPNINVFGPLLAFAILAITPEVVNLIDGAFKAKTGKMGQVIQGGFASGTALPGAVAGAISGRLMARDSKTGGATGTVARAFDRYVLNPKSTGSPTSLRYRANNLIRKGVRSLANTPNEYQVGELGRIEEARRQERESQGLKPVSRIYSTVRNDTGTDADKA